MMKKMRKFALLICVLALCVSACSVISFAAESAMAEIPFSLTLGGTLPEEAEEFSFCLTAADPSNPMPEGSVNGVYVTTLVGAGSGAFRIPCDRLGVFDYTVHQIPDENEDCTYSTEVYDVTVFVTNSEEGDGFVINVVAYKEDAEEKGEITFHNVYSNPDTVVVEALKTMDGETPKDGAFAFRLIDEEGKVVAEVKNAGKEITFPELSFYAVGTYKYTLVEVVGKDPKINYDATVYEVVVEVVRDENNDYQATLSYAKDGVALKDLPEFKNTTVPEVPKTGDESPIFIYFALMVASAAAIAVLFFALKRSKREE